MGQESKVSNYYNSQLFDRAAALLEVLSVGDAMELNQAANDNDLELMDALVKWYERRAKQQPRLISDIF